MQKVEESGNILELEVLLDDALSMCKHWSSLSSTDEFRTDCKRTITLKEWILKKEGTY